MRVGIIGGGFGLRVQYPIIQTHPHMDVVSVCTMNRHCLHETLQQGINHYKDWKKMIDTEQLQILFVSTIALHHYSIVKYAIQKGIHIVCEKPFMMNQDQSLEIINMAKQYDVKVVVDFEWRYFPIRQRAKELLDKQKIGDILHIEHHISSARYETLTNEALGWMGKKEKFGGMLGALGTHMIDNVRWMTSQEITYVQGMLHTHIQNGGGERRDADDAFFIHGLINYHISFSLQLLSGIHHEFNSMLKVFGTKGTLVIENDQRILLGESTQAFEELNLELSPVPYHLSPEQKAYYPALYALIDKTYIYITTDRVDRDLPTAVDGHFNQQILEQLLYKSNL